MRALALIRADDDVCWRCRLETHLPVLQAAGWEITPRPLKMLSLRERLSLFRAARDYDAVFVVRKLLPAWQTAFLRLHAKRLVFDFDDAIHLADRGPRATPRRPHSFWSSWIRRVRYTAMLRAADAVTVPTDPLAAAASAATDPRKVHLFPFCLDLQDYPAARHERSHQGVRIAWIGSRSTLASLDDVGPELARLPSLLESPELWVVADAFPRFDPLTVVPRPWSRASEAADLAACDIGVNWLPNHPWSLAKGSIKVLQYMAAGLPVVANRLGVNARYIQDGVDGFLVDDPRQFLSAVTTLARDPGLRRRMGEAGRRKIAREYDRSIQGARLVELLDGLATRETPSGSHVPSPHRSAVQHSAIR